MKKIVVYFMHPETGSPDYVLLEETELLLAIDKAKELRQAGKLHVIISTDFSNSVTKPGVDSVEDGKTPDGVEYTWMKRRSQ
jgi:hypothetical protein